MKSRGVDPADYVDADDVARLLGDESTIEVHAVESRVDPPPGSPHIADPRATATNPWPWPERSV